MSTMDDAKAAFFEGLACLERQDFANAETMFLRTLEAAPRSIPTLNNLAVAQYGQKKFREAGVTANKAIALDPANIDAYLMLSSCQKEDEDYEGALVTCGSIIKLDPTIAEAHCNRGYVLNELGQYEKAIDSIDRALAIQPNFPDALLNRGNSLHGLERLEPALAAYDKALALKPDLDGAWLGRGKVLFDLRRHAEALAAFDKALALKPASASACVGRGNVLVDLKRYDEALAAYDKAISIEPDLAGAWLGRGNVFFDHARYDEALAAYDKALSIKPDLAGAWLGRGNAFCELSRHDDALVAYDKALSIESDLADAWLGLGNVHIQRKDFAASFRAFDRAHALDRSLPYAEGLRLYSKMQLCDWNDFETERARLDQSIRAGIVAAPPYVLLAISPSPDIQLQCATQYSRKRYPPSKAPLWSGERYRHERLRVAYISTDMRNHALASLLVGLTERHDPKRVETIGISLHPDDGSDLRRRLAGSFGRFFELSQESDVSIAKKLRELEVDIAVDLMGYTANCRAGILAHRPAPLQVNYLCYTGTMGSPYIDYIVADRMVIPEASQSFYSEKVVYLPDSYQTSDTTRQIPELTISREQAGLPREGFVFCCFNNNFKITPEVFDRWIDILAQADGSVLWLLQDNAQAGANLLKNAAARGLDASRLVFAPRVSQREHLARHRLADLFLDTSPYNAHTTASDALWAGLPLLTCPGDTFASRVSASVLNALDLPELIAANWADYRTRAVALAKDPARLADVRKKLADRRTTAPFFNTALTARNLEDAYAAIYRRHFGVEQP